MSAFLVEAAGLVAASVVRAAEKSPEPEDVKAGWTAFAIFLLLALAVAFLGWSLVRQLRKADAARDAGVYGDPSPTSQREPAPTPGGQGDDESGPIDEQPGGEPRSP